MHPLSHVTTYNDIYRVSLKLPTVLSGIDKQRVSDNIRSMTGPKRAELLSKLIAIKYYRQTAFWNNVEDTVRQEQFWGEIESQNLLPPNTTLYDLMTFIKNEGYTGKIPLELKELLPVADAEKRKIVNNFNDEFRHTICSYLTDATDVYWSAKSYGSGQAVRDTTKATLITEVTKLNGDALNRLSDDEQLKNILIVLRTKCSEKMLLEFITGKASLEECAVGNPWIVNLLSTNPWLQVKPEWFGRKASHYLSDHAINTFSDINQFSFWENEDTTIKKLNQTLDGIVASFERIHLKQSNLDEIDLQGADLQGARLAQSRLTGAKLQNACLNNTDLSRTDLREAHLEGAELQNSALCYTRLDDAHLQGANLKGANLYEAFLWGADLRGANLRRADLRKVIFGVHNDRKTDLRGADLRGIDCRLSNLKKAGAEGRVDLRGAISDDPEIQNIIKAQESENS